MFILSKLMAAMAKATPFGPLFFTRGFFGDRGYFFPDAVSGDFGERPLASRFSVDFRLVSAGERGFGLAVAPPALLRRRGESAVATTGGSFNKRGE